MPPGAELTAEQIERGRLILKRHAGVKRLYADVFPSEYLLATRRALKRCPDGALGQLDPTMAEEVHSFALLGIGEIIALQLAPVLNPRERSRIEDARRDAQRDN